MSKRVGITFLAAAGAALALAATSGVATAKPTAATRVVPIVMADPGCHWFLVSGKKLAKLTVSGKTTFRNLDEAALTFAGNKQFQKVDTGKTITISAPGTYKIKMVRQLKHDNTLVLVVK